MGSDEVLDDRIQYAKIAARGKLRPKICVGAYGSAGVVALQSRGISGSSAPAVELCALLDGQRYVMDVALDVRRRLQSYHYSANDTRNLPAYDHPLGADGAGDLTLFADDDLAARYIALHLTVHLKRALADDLKTLAEDFQIVSDDRFGPRFR